MAPPQHGRQSIFLSQTREPYLPKSSPALRIMSIDSSQTTAVISALGTLVGYIGAEAATEDVFERLLWPQRFFNAVSRQDFLQIGFLTPMGGPLHRAAVATLDTMHRNGLFRGRSLGNMLGTAFFHDSGLKYKVHEQQKVVGKEHVRSGVWVRAVQRVAMPATIDKERHAEDGITERKIVRARSVVSLLELSHSETVKDSKKTVRNDASTITLRCILTIIWSEITGLAAAGLAFGYWRSYFSLLWLMPLFLKLVSVISVIPREDLQGKLASKDTHPESTKQFEVNTKGHGFLVVEGTESVVLQFFRHYGHPIRVRWRELTQLGIIIAFGALFPIGLVCSLLWMPVGLQFLWLSYQLYATTAMYIYRYARGHQWATTESRLAQRFSEGDNEERIAYLQSDRRSAIMGKLTRIYVGSYGAGQQTVEALLAQRQGGPEKEVKEVDGTESDSTSDILQRTGDKSN